MQYSQIEKKKISPYFGGISNFFILAPDNITLMATSFQRMIRVLSKLGDVSTSIPQLKNGKPSKFNGSLVSQSSNRDVNLGILHFNWKRSIGVDKINQAIQQTEKVGLDGAIMIGTKFSRSAIEQAFRINQLTSKRILLMEAQEFDALQDIDPAGT